MRILYSLPHPADRLDSDENGFTVRARALLEALSQRHAIEVVEAAADAPMQAAVSAYRQHFRRMLPSTVALRARDMARVAGSLRYGNRLLQAIRQFQPDVILETHIGFSIGAAVASHRSGVPLVLDDVTPSWEEGTLYAIGSTSLARWTHRYVTNRARLCVTVSEPLRRFLHEDGIDPQKVIVIPNGIHLHFLDKIYDRNGLRHRLGIPGGALVVVFVGSFQPYHQVELLLEAAAMLPPDQRFHLLIVGGGQRQADAQVVAARLGLDDRTTFTGTVPHPDVAHLLAASDIAVVPATNAHGNLMKIYEYMALGLPIVAPDQETITEVVTGNRTCSLFEPGNARALADALHRLASDPHIRETMGKAARRGAFDHTWMRRAERLEHVLDTLTRQRAAA